MKDIRDYEYILIPKFLKEFKCSCCGECCKGKWNITGTKKESVEINKTMDELSLNSFEYYNLTETGLAMKFNQKGYCAFCDDDILCKLQKNKGVEVLVDACRVYPRNIALTTRGIEIGMNFSCPTVAKRFLRTEEFEISKIKVEDFNLVLPRKISYFDVRNTTIPSMVKTFELEKKVVELLKGKERKIPQIFEEIIQLYLTEEVLEAISKGEKEVGDETLGNILNNFLLEREKEASTREVMVQKLLKGYTESKGKGVLENKERVNLTTELYNEITDGFDYGEKIYGGLFKNLIGTAIFRDKKGQFKEYILYELIILLLILKLVISLEEKNKKKELSSSELVELIRLTSEEYEHSKGSFNSFFEKIKEEGVYGVVMATLRRGL